jgi:hypothetical protein
MIVEYIDIALRAVGVTPIRAPGIAIMSWRVASDRSTVATTCIPTSPNLPRRNDIQPHLPTLINLCVPAERRLCKNRPR